MRHTTHDAWLPIVLGALYVAQGLTFGMMMEALPTLLRAGGASLELVALVPLATVPWMVKVFWAPLVDNRGSRRLGRRRGWILPTQAVLVAALLTIAALPVDADGAVAIIGLLGLATLAASTQDIATDGLAAERLGRPRMSQAGSLQVGGMMAGTLIGGAGTLVLSDLVSPSIALSVMAGLIALSAVPVLLWREPPPVAGADEAPARLRAFFRSRAGWALAGLALVFANGHAVNTALARLFLVDQSWSLSHIGMVLGSGTAVAVILGSVLANPLVRRFGAVPVALAGLLLATAGPLLWVSSALSGSPIPLTLALAAVLTDGVGSGLCFAAVLTLAFRFAHGGRQAGTDLTMVQCLHGFGGMAMVGVTTFLTAKTGFVWGFAAAFGCILVAIAALLATWRICEPTPAPGSTPATDESCSHEQPLANA